MKIRGIGTESKNLIFKGFITALLLLVGIFCLLPLVWMISTSFKFEIDVFEYPIRWIPKRWNFNTYAKVFSDNSFYLYYFNSIKVTFLACAGNLFFASLAAYAFARLRFKGREVMFFMYLATMMIPNQVILVPKYIIYRYIGIYDTHLALFLPGFFEVFGVFLLRQAFKVIPPDFSEAAVIDGAGQFRTFFQIILPMAKPTLITLTLLNFTNYWNDYINPKIFLLSDSLYTLTIGLQKFQISNSSNYSTIMAGTVISLIPILIVFLTAQKYFVSSFASSGIKG